jgi:hypothetical protein
MFLRSRTGRCTPKNDWIANHDSIVSHQAAPDQNQPGHSHSQPGPRIEEAMGKGGRRRIWLEAIIVDKNVLASMKRPQAEAIKWFAKPVSEATEDSQDKGPRGRLLVRMDPERRISTFESEDAGTEPPGSNDFDAALADAREKGVNVAAQILAGCDMLSGSAFAKFVGISRKAIRAKHRGTKFLTSN